MHFGLFYIRICKGFADFLEIVDFIDNLEQIAGGSIKFFKVVFEVFFFFNCLCYPIKQFITTYI